MSPSSSCVSSEDEDFTPDNIESWDKYYSMKHDKELITKINEKYGKNI